MGFVGVGHRVEEASLAGARVHGQRVTAVAQAVSRAVPHRAGQRHRLSRRAQGDGKQAAALERLVRAPLAEHPEQVGDRGREIEQVHELTHAHAPRPGAGREADHEGDAHAGLVELHVVADPAVLEQLLAVVRGHDHDRLLP